jgi:adenylylsulfate kinase-like enzyme
MIYWFTGQPGAGKTTLAIELYKTIKNDTAEVIHIDGDDLRDIFNNKVYTIDGRLRNIERAYDIAYFMEAKGFDVIVSMVSPYREQREKFKQNSNFVEIYVHTTNIRGREHYHVKDYEAPTTNFIEIDTTDTSELKSFENLINKLKL